MWSCVANGYCMYYLIQVFQTRIPITDIIMCQPLWHVKDENCNLKRRIDKDLKFPILVSGIVVLIPPTSPYT